MMNFNEVTFEQILRNENDKADALAKLASSSMEALDHAIHLEELLSLSFEKEAIL